MSLESITIFTDGSSRGNPGPGGFGAVFIVPERNEENHESPRPNVPLRDGRGFKIQELGGREEHTTNNRMELQAAIQALTYLQGSTFFPIQGRTLEIVIYSDSSYLINGITKWVHGWQKNGWVSSLKKPVENRDLWEQLLNVTIYRNIEWKQVGGHVGVAGNQRCDEIATAFADGKTPQLYSGILKNYGIKNILDITPNVPNPNNFSKRKLERAKAYSYVSMVDGIIQTHKTWAECEKRVKGKPARYKKALSAEEEQTLIREWRGK